MWIIPPWNLSNGQSFSPRTMAFWPEEEEMNHIGKIAAAALITLTAGTASAWADACSGRSHDTGTALGAVGGGLVGGLATHSVAGGLGGAVVGGLAGNAIARSDDCRHRARVHRESYYTDRYGHRHYYYR
jgi:hypothetical protein